MISAKSTLNLRVSVIASFDFQSKQCRCGVGIFLFLGGALRAGSETHPPWYIPEAVCWIKP